MSRQAGIYNITRTIRSILKRHRKDHPSLLMHLHSNGFRFGAQETVHAYDGDMKHWIDFIREQKMPNELLAVLDDARVRFFDGNLIVEVHDHRSGEVGKEDIPSPPGPSQQVLPQSTTTKLGPVTGAQVKVTGKSVQAEEEVERYRIVLSPTCETLWRDIQLLNEERMAQLVTGVTRKQDTKSRPMTEEEALEVEAAILERTSPALCLSPTIVTSRIANALLAETTLAEPRKASRSRKRPLSSAEEESQRRKKERKVKFMNVGDEAYGSDFNPSFARFDFIAEIRNMRQKGLSISVPAQASASGSRVPGQATSNLAMQSSIPVHPLAANVMSPPNAPSPAANVVRPGAAGNKKRVSILEGNAGSPENMGSPDPSTFVGNGPGGNSKAKNSKKPVVELTAEAEEKRKKKAEQRLKLKLKKAAAAAAAAAATSTATGVGQQGNNPGQAPPGQTSAASTPQATPQSAQTPVQAPLLLQQTQAAATNQQNQSNRQVNQYQQVSQHQAQQQQQQQQQALTNLMTTHNLGAAQAMSLQQALFGLAKGGGQNGQPPPPQQQPQQPPNPAQVAAMIQAYQQAQQSQQSQPPQQLQQQQQLNTLANGLANFVQGQNGQPMLNRNQPFPPAPQQQQQQQQHSILVPQQQGQGISEPTDLPVGIGLPSSNTNGEVGNWNLGDNLTFFNQMNNNNNNGGGNINVNDSSGGQNQTGFW